LSNFLIGEGKLELYLEENPPTETNIPHSKNGLLEARKYLEMCTGDSTKKVEVSLDALLLLAKLEFACGNYKAAMGRLDDAGLHHLTEKMLPTRSLRVVAESYAIEALCLEKTSLPHNSKFQQADRYDKMIRCFELAGDLTLLYLQEQDKLASTPSTQSLPSLAASVNTTGTASPLPPNGEENKKMGIILETALQRAPILYMKAGKIDLAISRYRNMLMAVESSATQHLRLTLARQLAEVLLRGCSDNAYTQPLKEPEPQRPEPEGDREPLEASQVLWQQAIRAHERQRGDHPSAPHQRGYGGARGRALSVPRIHDGADARLQQRDRRLRPALHHPRQEEAVPDPARVLLPPTDVRARHEILVRGEPRVAAVRPGTRLRQGPGEGAKGASRGSPPPASAAAQLPPRSQDLLPTPRKG
ncbi:UNVERIFIED_CONTAM: hypothetical protein GTU68_019980, partial [Idotea baltica]|nr:hypothetical protein [Idotea baltica]